VEVNISSIKDQKGGQLKFRLVEDWSDLKINETTLKTIDPVVFIGKVTWTGEYFLVRGAVETKIEISCARCLKPGELPIKVEIDERFRRASRVMDDGYLEDEPDVTEEWDDEDFQEFRGLTIDLDEVVAENLIVSIPIKPLCRKDCPGLCPMCGQDLNEGECGCEIDDINPRMSVLKRLLDSDGRQ